MPEIKFRDFNCLQEIQPVDHELNLIEFIGKILSSLHSFSYSEGLDWKTVILNGFINDQIEGVHFLLNLEDPSLWLKKPERKERT